MYVSEAKRRKTRANASDWFWSYFWLDAKMAGVLLSQSRSVNAKPNQTLKAIPLELFYYQTFLKLGVINVHDMNI